MADVGKSRILLLTDRVVARWMPGTGLWKQAWGKGRRFRATPRKPQVMRLSDSTVGAAPGFESAISSLGKKLSTESDHFLGQRAMVQAFMRDEKRLEWVRPTGGVTAFPRVRESVPFDGARFYHTLQHDYGTMVGPGHWFGQPDRCFRLGYGYPTASELSWSLVAISKSLDSVG